MAPDGSRTVGFTRMEDGTREDYELLDRLAEEQSAALPDRLLASLRGLAGSFDGYPVDRLTHSLQSATRALRDGRDEEYVVCALLHDIGDLLAPWNHSELAAAVLRPYVSAENWWTVKHHGIFQGYYYFHHLGGDRDERDRYRDHPCWERTREFCALYDQNCFDPAYETLPLEQFEPMLRRIFARKPFAAEHGAAAE